ncbi:hypothetical protein APR50_33885 [Variovorax paradoxus]|uniref:hypothetical protein n=1 Tax=Comamonadaceae TaxID=80864 RepID=UPI00056E1C75|nr:hypothetical protein [Xenophilus azovorans]KPU89202.1 hypothetical protein APR52_39460 [Variovorax paradoxus]KPU96711.1 hypothetical protein APR49_36460 [Variovorax paradoxus]KPU98779.1 hypothetical protein APR50_33885 [Variovorax paradoxus]KPV15403.1 hypothetical protein APR51_34590 [Variovorax paradoxus]KPV26386.1 hypothetical protein APR48_31320 [Variovorax paradoxus]
MQYLYTLVTYALAALSIVGCGKQEAAESPAFDPKYIAAEADKGNLEPLKKLNSACSAEVQRTGARGGACSAQDEVGGLRKPLNIRF